MISLLAAVPIVLWILLLHRSSTMQSDPDALMLGLLLILPVVALISLIGVGTGVAGVTRKRRRVLNWIGLALNIGCLIVPAQMLWESRPQHPDPQGIPGYKPSVFEHWDTKKDERGQIIEQWWSFMSFDSQDKMIAFYDSKLPNASKGVPLESSRPEGTVDYAYTKPDGKLIRISITPEYGFRITESLAK